MRKHAEEQILSYAMYLHDFVSFGEEKEESKKGKKKDPETLRNLVDSRRYIHGKPLGDYIFLPGDDDLYKLPDGRILKGNEAAFTGYIDQNREKHMFVMTGWPTGNQQILRHVEVFRVNKDGKKYAGQPDTEYEFAVSVRVDDKKMTYNKFRKNKIS